MFRITFLSLFILSFLLVIGCGEPVNPPEIPKPPVSKYGGVYRRAFNSQVITLDPRDIADTYSHEVARQIFDGLVEYDSETKVVPSIADSWEISTDRMQYNFRLRDNCRFHAVFGPQAQPTKNGGRLVTAQDVSYSFHRLLNPKSMSARSRIFWVIKGAKSFNEGKSDKIEGIKILASDSITFILEKPFAPFLSLLALSNAFIVPPEDSEGDGVDFGKSPVGTGPFIWGGIEKDTVILNVNLKYFRGRPYLDRVEFPVIPDEKERFQAFLRGELQHTDVPNSEYMNVRQDPKWAKLFQESSRWGTHYLGFNVTSPPFDNSKVRRAFNFAIDREGIVKFILNDRAKVARGVIPPGIFAYNPNLEGFSYDISKAKRLLAEAGYPDGKGFPEIVLQTNRDAFYARLGEFVLANLRDIGITCTIKEMEFSEHLKSVEDGQVSFFRMGWIVDYPDPDDLLFTLLHSSMIGPGGNFSKYKSVRVDEILDEARFEIDPQIRIKLYQRAEQFVVDDAPWVFLFHFTTHLLRQPQVHGLLLTPMGSPLISYREIWLEKKTAK